MSRSALTRHALQKSLRGQSALDQPPEETQRRVKQDELPMCVSFALPCARSQLDKNV
jgi:hypothetical protein